MLKDDELPRRLKEAAKWFGEGSGINEQGLRRAARLGLLKTYFVCGKEFTSKADVLVMIQRGSRTGPIADATTAAEARAEAVDSQHEAAVARAEAAIEAVRGRA